MNLTDDPVQAPALAHSKCSMAGKGGWKGTMLFESEERAKRGQWIAARETLTVGGGSP